MIVYTAEVPFETDVLNSNKFPYVGAGRVTAAILGQATLLNGLDCVPTGPATLSADVGSGEIYSLQATDSTPYGVLPVDTNPLYKQGIYFGPNNFSTPAPVGVGDSINYLIQVAFVEVDNTATTRPYFNPADPDNPFFFTANGTRSDECVVSIKAGVAAPTGTQTTPTPDPGNTGAWVITVANGQTTVDVGDINVYPGAPFITEKLGDKISLATGDARYARIQQAEYDGGIVNGGMVIAQRESLGFSSGLGTPPGAYGLVDTYLGLIDNYTTFTAGTLTQSSTAPIGRTGYSCVFSGITTTGASTFLDIRQAMESNLAVNYINQISSFSGLAYQDTGVTLNYVIEILKADVKNNFTTTTIIATSSPIAVQSGTPTLLKFEGVNLGACGNGLLVHITSTIGAVTTKNFHFTEWQLNIGSFATPFVYRDESESRASCKRRFQKSYDDGVTLGTVLANGAYSGNAASTAIGGLSVTVPLSQTMVRTPTCSVYSPTTGTTAFIEDATAAADLAGTTINTNEKGFVVVNNAAATVGNRYQFHWVAIADF